VPVPLLKLHGDGKEHTFRKDFLSRHPTLPRMPYVSRIDAKVVLIDGETLAQLMVEYNVGVSTIEIK
jgi:hypothetical protein